MTIKSKFIGANVFIVALRALIKWLAYHAVYAGASSVIKFQMMFQPSSPLNNKRLRVQSRQDLVDNYAGQELWVGGERGIMVNAMYIDCISFKRKQLQVIKDAKELAVLADVLPDGDTVILFLGNNEYFEEEESKLRARWYLLLGKNVLLFNYPGYGDSQGRLSHRQTDEASHLLYSVVQTGRVFDCKKRVWLQVASEGKRPEQIILHGYSIGGGVAARLSAFLKSQGFSCPRLLLDRTFDNIFQVAKLYVPEFLRTNQTVLKVLNEVLEEDYNYDIGHALKNLNKRKLFIVHADEDELMQAEAKGALTKAAQGELPGIVVPVVSVQRKHADMWDDVVADLKKNGHYDVLAAFLQARAAD